MPSLSIDDKDYEAKLTFSFARLADKKYKTTSKGPDGKDVPVGGVENIYQKLMGYDPNGLFAFWDCALEIYARKKAKPSLYAIEDALYEKVNAGDGADKRMFQEAFTAIENSGFFRLKIKEFWSNLDLMVKMADNEKEVKKAKQAKEIYEKKHQDLLA